MPKHLQNAIAILFAGFRCSPLLLSSSDFTSIGTVS